MILDAMGSPLPPSDPPPAPPPFVTPLNPADLEREFKRLEIVTRQATMLLRGTMAQIAEGLLRLYRLPDKLLATQIQTLPPAIARDVVEMAGRFAAFIAQQLVLIPGRDGSIAFEFLPAPTQPPAQAGPAAASEPETEAPAAGQVPPDETTTGGDGFTPATEAPAE